MEIPERRHWLSSGLFIVNVKQISYISEQMHAGYFMGSKNQYIKSRETVNFISRNVMTALPSSVKMLDPGFYVLRGLQMKL